MVRCLETLGEAQRNHNWFKRCKVLLVFTYLVVKFKNNVLSRQTLWSDNINPVRSEVGLEACIPAGQVNLIILWRKYSVNLVCGEGKTGRLVSFSKHSWWISWPIVIVALHKTVRSRNPWTFFWVFVLKVHSGPSRNCQIWVLEAKSEAGSHACRGSVWHEKTGCIGRFLGGKQLVLGQRTTKAAGSSRHSNSHYSGSFVLQPWAWWCDRSYEASWDDRTDQSWVFVPFSKYLERQKQTKKKNTFQEV